MKTMTNITNTRFDLERFKDGADMLAFFEKHGLDGFELLPIDGETPGDIPADRIIGVHLPYYNSWVDFWNGHTDSVASEFGTLEEAEKTYGGSQQAIVERYRRQLAFAESLKAEYVVFHVADVSIEESITYRLRHSDEEVASAALELIREILDGKDYPFYFLIENLWWPGLTMKRPEITRLLLDGIPCGKKGIMLDIGHLMHTNLSLTSQEEAIGYINGVLDAHGTLCGCIKGVHLHQSLSGAYIRKLMQSPPKLEGSYFERLCQAYGHVLAIDTHKPFTGRGIRGLIERLAPEFLTYEFISESREDFESYLELQNRALHE